jgi:hypothetical protein
MSLGEFSINIFLLKVFEYRDFFIIHAISKQLGKSQFLVKKTVAQNCTEFIQGLVYSIRYKERENNNLILEFELHEKINLLKIKPWRLFAMQSLCALIYQIVHNIDDISKIVNLIPQILLIFVNKNWLKIYLYLEFKILLIYDIDNILKDCNKVKQINLALGDRLLDKSETFSLKEVFHSMDKLWYGVDKDLIIPKERSFFYKILNIGR